MKQVDLLVLIFPDALPWERLSVEGLVRELSCSFQASCLKWESVKSLPTSQLPKAEVIWVVSSNWYRASQSVRKKFQFRTIFASVLGAPPKRGLPLLFWKKTTVVVPPDVKVLVHSPLNFRFYREIAQVSEQDIAYQPFPTLDSSFFTAKKTQSFW